MLNGHNRYPSLPVQKHSSKTNEDSITYFISRNGIPMKCQVCREENSYFGWKFPKKNNHECTK